MDYTLGRYDRFIRKKEIIEGEEVDTTFTSAIQLFVPGATPKDPVSYQTNLVWILSDLPTNK